MDSTINCRKYGSLFDVSHMCGLSLKGKDAIAFIEKLVVGDIAGLKDNSGSLSVFTNEKGGIIDDTVVTKVQLQTLLSHHFGGSCRPLSSIAVVLCIRCSYSFSICFEGLVWYQVIPC
jgi:glycine cleavage system aminomethyltransferase T